MCIAPSEVTLELRALMFEEKLAWPVIDGWTPLPHEMLYRLQRALRDGNHHTAAVGVHMRRARAERRVERRVRRGWVQWVCASSPYADLVYGHDSPNGL